MINRTQLRVAAAAITVVGGLHVGTAEAAAPARFDDCDNKAIGYGTGYCDAKLGTTGWTSGEITYTCNPNGTITVQTVDCYTD